MQAVRKKHFEQHYSEKIGWLRAAVLGANDGIVSTASLVVGIAAANIGRKRGRRDLILITSTLLFFLPLYLFKYHWGLRLCINVKLKNIRARIMSSYIKRSFSDADFFFINFTI